MTRPPFGFGPSDRPDEPEGNGDSDPFGLSALFGGALFGGAPGSAGPGGFASGPGGDVFANLAQLMSWTGGPVNWDLAVQIARAAVEAADAKPAGTEVGPEAGTEVGTGQTQAQAVADACRLADLWLDPLTTLPASAGQALALSRTEWIEMTLPAWKKLVEPVASRVVTAMGGAMGGVLGGGLAGIEGLPPEVADLLGADFDPQALNGVMAQVGGLVFGAQVGQALGALAGEVLGLSEVGLPLAQGGRSGLLPANVAAFTEGLEIPADEVRLYLALREQAHQRLFAHVPWLTAHLFDAVDAYARGIEVDPQVIERAVGSVDPNDPESLQNALGQGLFDIEPTAAQTAALARLETALALVEGWVDAVVDEAASGPLPSAAALRETLRRRRAAGGPAEQMFATLVGLQLRPRRLREAAELWTQVRNTRGMEGRDALWAHPDLLPGPDELDDPAGFLLRTASSEGDAATDWDAALRDLGNPPAAES